MSKRMLAAMKPSMWEPPRSANVNNVTINPVSEIAPNFLVHHATSISDVKARKSHRNGMWVIRQKTGESVLFRTAHKAAHMIMAVMSRVLK